MIIQRFRSRRSGQTYEVTLEDGLRCTSLGFRYHRRCKHIVYVRDNLHDAERGMYFSELIDIPTCEEAQRMSWGEDREQAERWHDDHLRVIEL